MVTRVQSTSVFYSKWRKWRKGGKNVQICLSPQKSNPLISKAKQGKICNPASSNLFWQYKHKNNSDNTSKTPFTSHRHIQTVSLSENPFFLSRIFWLLKLCMNQLIGWSCTERRRKRSETVCFFKVRMGRGNDSRQCYSTLRYGTEVTHATG